MLELIVVLAVIGLVAAFAVPSVFAGRVTAEIKTASKAVVDGLRRARTLAVYQGREVPFVMDVEGKRFRVADGKPVSLPTRVSFAMRTASDEVQTDAQGAIRFFPDGSSTGGRVDVFPEGREAAGTRVAIDWLTGRVTTLPLQEAAR